jgi:hypothetical protein
VEHTVGHGDLQCGRREFGEADPTVRSPRTEAELKPPMEPVTGVGVPVPAGFAAGDGVPVDAAGVSVRHASVEDDGGAYGGEGCADHEPGDPCAAGWWAVVPSVTRWHHAP